MVVRVRRIYDSADDTDGKRVLVDRLWPRGISKEQAHLDEWCKEVAPSNELREWYGHDPVRRVRPPVPGGTSAARTRASP
ncbi:hypothetical protein GCM10009804_32250 [Kribbella hippodromi]|uniref:DUF488 family protein n=1 Tax=Kribbella hippodromi TaxID=434347 RepID=A0ABN2DDK6_9ACTN